MAGGGLVVLRGNDVYIGAAKEATWGTDVAPTWWWRWLNGTSYRSIPTYNREREGDTSVHISFVYKGDQYHEVTITEYGRPIMLGYALQGIGGTASDTFTTAPHATTLSSSVAAGATTCSLAGDQGNLGTRAYNFTPGYSTAVYEVVTLDLTTRTGAGPFTYTVAAGGKFLNAHASSDPVRDVSTHLFKPVATTFDPYTLEVGWGFASGTLQRGLRFLDAVCYDVEIHSQSGRPLMCTHKWYAASIKKIASLSTPTFEGTNVIGGAGAPFTHFQAGSTWLVDNLGTGNAATIKAAKISMKREIQPKALISEKINPLYFLLGNFTTEVSLTADFTSFAQYDETILGTATPGTGAVDSTLTVFGQASVTWSADAINSCALSLPNQAYVTPDLPHPKSNSEPLTTTFVAVASKSPSVTDPVQFTLSNSWNSQY